MSERTVKIGLHRGKPRFWIQGKHLEAAGWPQGTLFTVSIDEDGMVIRKAKQDATHRVSGTKGKAAIIDVNGAELFTAFPEPPCMAVATITNNTIKVERANG